MKISDESLSKLLVDNAYLPLASVELSVLNAKEKGISLTESLTELDLISDQNLGKIVADSFTVPFVELAKLTIKKDVLLILPLEVAANNLVMSFELTAVELKIAMCDPQDHILIQNISRKVGLSVKVSYATEKDIKAALHLYKDDLQKSFDTLLAQRFGDQKGTSIEEFPITQTVDLLVEYAYSERASDIHIEPESEHVLVRFRIDGIMHDVLKGPKALHEQIITRIKILSQLRTDEHASAQDGKFRLTLPEEELDVRVSIAPIVEGEKAVLRLLSSRSRQFGLSDLGMSKDDIEKVKAAFHKPYGMILCTGPTGSGKTTSIYSIVKILNTREKNIATIEDPVEYEIDGINQIQVNQKTNLTFATGLRSILRQDPDIVFVGEIRDDETAGIAINSAMTGHLVLSTLHANDAATTFPRLMDLHVEPFLSASTVSVVIAQRLARKICEHCRVSSIVTKDILVQEMDSELADRLLQGKAEQRIYQGKGCPVCHNTGYVGRIGLFEVLVVSEAMKSLISKRTDSQTIADQARIEGMKTMFDDGILKVLEGITTIAEIVRAVKE